MNIVAYFLVTMLSLASFAAVSSGLPTEERPWIGFAYVMHLAGTAGILYLHYFVGSDLDGYERGGLALAGLLSTDFSYWAVETVKSLFQLEGSSNLGAAAGSTQSMRALSGIIFFITRAESLPPVSFAVSAFGFCGRGLLYRVARRVLAPSERRSAAIACMMVPSTVLWSSGLVKEAWAMTGLGLLVWGLYEVFQGRQVLAILPAALGAILIGVIKPYTLFPTVLAGGGWILALRGKTRKIRPLHVLFAAAVGAAGLVAMGKLFPEFGVDHLADTIQGQRYYGNQAGGGSYVGSEDDANLELEGASLTGQTKNVPLALISAFFRPFLFEARSAPQLAAAIESTVLLVMLVGVLYRVKWRRLQTELLGSPILLASAIFVLTFGVAVGLATPNLGTLSRYRAPMMPMYALVVLVLRQRTMRAADAVAKAPGPAKLTALRLQKPR